MQNFILANPVEYNTIKFLKKIAFVSGMTIA